MNIGFDYDGTYTRDPKFWDEFLENAVRAGHKVYLVTGRYGPLPLLIERHVHVPTGQWKVDACRSQGVRIDVWIDDMPQLIAPQGMLRWREEEPPA